MGKTQNKKNMLSERLKNLREDNGLSQEELAEELSRYAECEKCSYQNISNWENAVYTPRQHYLDAYTDFFSCTIDYLRGKSHSPNMTKEEWDRKTEKENNAICKSIDDMFDDKFRNMQITFLNSILSTTMIDCIACNPKDGKYLIATGTPETGDYYRTVLSEDQFCTLSEMVRTSVINTVNAFVEMSKKGESTK